MKICKRNIFTNHHCSHTFQTFPSSYFRWGSTIIEEYLPIIRSLVCSRLHSARSCYFWRKLAIRQHTEPLMNFITCASIFFTMRRSPRKMSRVSTSGFFHSAILPALPRWIAKPRESRRSSIPCASPVVMGSAYIF
jgi:hypothetical protein